MRDKGWTPAPTPLRGPWPSSLTLPPACLSSPCLNGGTCHLIVATGTTVCACPPGFAGRLCNIGECVSPPGCPGAVPGGPPSGLASLPLCPQRLMSAASWGMALGTAAWPAPQPRASAAWPGTPIYSTRSCMWTRWAPRPCWAWAPTPTAGQHHPTPGHHTRGRQGLSWGEAPRLPRTQAGPAPSRQAPVPLLGRLPEGGPRSSHCPRCGKPPCWGLRCPLPMPSWQAV